MKRKGKKAKKTEKKKKVLLGDVAVSSPDEDMFFFYEDAKSVAEILLKVLKGSSVAYAVRGPWGSGKTSFMKLVQWVLRNRKGDKVLTVWFDAWKFKDAVHLGDALVYEVLRCMVDELEGELGKDSNDVKTLVKELKRVENELGKRRDFWCLLKRGVGAAIATAADVSVTPPYAKGAIRIGKSVFDSVKSTHKIEKSVEKLLGVLRKHRVGLVAFLDDLDRADSEQVAGVLSTVKQYLDKKNVAFVIGYDEEYILKALGSQLPEEISPSDYLQKIVTLARSVPTLRKAAVQKYALGLLSEVAPSSFRLSGPAMKLCNSSHFNPRRLKRMCLSFGQMSTAYSTKYSKVKEEQPFASHLISSFVVLQEYAPQVLNRMAQILAGTSYRRTQLMDALQGMPDTLEKELSLPQISEGNAKLVKAEIELIKNQSPTAIIIRLIRSLSGFPDVPLGGVTQAPTHTRGEQQVGKTIFNQHWFVKLFEKGMERRMVLSGEAFESPIDVELPEAKTILNLSEISRYAGGAIVGVMNFPAILDGKEETWFIIHDPEYQQLFHWVSSHIAVYCVEHPTVLWIILDGSKEDMLRFRDFVKNSALADKVTMYISGPKEVEKLQEELVSKLIKSGTE